MAAILNNVVYAQRKSYDEGSALPGCRRDPYPATLPNKCWACDVDWIEDQEKNKERLRNIVAFVIYAYAAAWDDLLQDMLQDMGSELLGEFLRREYAIWNKALKQECWGKVPSTCMHCVAIDSYQAADAILGVIDAMDANVPGKALV